MDVNKTTHIGTVVTSPTLITLGSNTQAAIFSLKCEETWESQGKTRSRDNVIVFEGLKKNAHWIKANVKVGRRYVIDGMVRVDENMKEPFRIRIFRIQEVMSDDFSLGETKGRKEAITQAINILNTSDDKNITLAKLEVLLDHI